MSSRRQVWRGTERDDDVFDQGRPNLHYITNTSRILPSRWSPATRPRRDPLLLSFDVFGYALAPVVLHPSDLHRLVGAALERAGTLPATEYRTRRSEAEAAARRRAAEEGREEIATAEIGEELATLLGGRSSVADAAIEAELDLAQELYRANPEAKRIHDQARERGIKVAFVADSHLPRDLVAKILQQVGFASDAIIVSSQEGATKSTGRLYESLVERTGVDPARMTHIGPDPRADVHDPGQLGMLTALAVDGRHEVLPLVSLGEIERSGLDGIGLALAADRLIGAEVDATAADIGYYAAGPLATGFVAWVDRTADEARADHIVFSGPAGRLLRRIATIACPALGTQPLQHLEHQHGEPISVGSVGRMIDGMNLVDGQRILVVDVGWHGRPHRQIAAAMASLGPSVEVIGAYAGDPTTAGEDHQTRLWAFGSEPGDPLAALAARRIEVLDALLPPLAPSRSTYNNGGHYGAAIPEIAAGIQAFATDFGPWLQLDPNGVTAALAEPAVRVLHNPTFAEADLLGRYQIASDGETGASIPLAELPLRAGSEPLADADGAAWPAGYQALLSGAAKAAGRRRRRNLRAS